MADDSASCHSLRAPEEVRFGFVPGDEVTRSWAWASHKKARQILRKRSLAGTDRVGTVTEQNLSSPIRSSALTFTIFHGPSPHSAVCDDLGTLQGPAPLHISTHGWGDTCPSLQFWFSCHFTAGRPSAALSRVLSLIPGCQLIAQTGYSRLLSSSSPRRFRPQFDNSHWQVVYGPSRSAIFLPFRRHLFLREFFSRKPYCLFLFCDLIPLNSYLDEIINKTKS
jgi:hypothetical protein